jgi:hypothetical protein
MSKLITGARTARATLLACALALLALPRPAQAQYMSCGAFLELDPTLQHIYITGFVEGVTYTQLELSQLVTSQAADKQLEDGEKLVLSVMQRVADNIAQAVPSGLTVEEVTDRLKELCGPNDKDKAAFVNIYSEYSLGLRAAARTRAEQQRASGGAPAPAPAPAAAKPAPAAAKPAPATAKPAAAQRPAAAPAKPAQPAKPPAAPAQPAKPAQPPEPAQKPGTP